jgi:hypothetical protein
MPSPLPKAESPDPRATIWGMNEMLHLTGCPPDSLWGSRYGVDHWMMPWSGERDWLPMQNRAVQTQDPMLWTLSGRLGLSGTAQLSLLFP